MWYRWMTSTFCKHTRRTFQEPQVSRDGHSGTFAELMQTAKVNAGPHILPFPLIRPAIVISTRPQIFLRSLLGKLCRLLWCCCFLGTAPRRRIDYWRLYRTSHFFLMTRFMFPFILIGLFFAVGSLFMGLLALCTRIGSLLSSSLAWIALMFQIISSCLMT